MKKTISIERLYYSITPYVFIILMGGFIAYHIVVGYGVIPAFLGGYFGIASVVVAAIYLLRFPNTLKMNIKRLPIATFIHLSIFTIALTVTFLSSLYNDTPSGAVTQSYNTLILWVSLFLIGFHLLRSNIEKTIRLSYAFYIMFSVFVVIYIISTKSLMLNLTLLSDADSGDVAGYQSLARNLLVISLLLICYSKKISSTLFLTLSSSFLFFYLGARSELAAFIFFIILYTLLKVRHQKKYLFLIIAIFLGLLVLSSVFREELMSSRQLQLLDLEDSSSWQARKYLSKQNINLIKDHPIMGYFGGHALISGSTGSYAHSSLSAYVNYGLFFFIGYVVLSIYSTLISLLKVLKKNSQSYWWYAFSINSVCLLMIIFAKPVFWVIPFFAWGVFFSAKTIDQSSVQKTTQ